MITKNDCLTILVRMGDEGIVGTEPFIRKLLGAKEPPIEVLQFISKNMGFDATNFYEHVRKNYNNKKSDLYKNIVTEQENPAEAAIILSCLLTQIMLYSRKIDEKSLFYKEVRAEEITRVLNTYFVEDSYESCLALLKLIRADLLVLEYINGRRELE